MGRRADSGLLGPSPHAPHASSSASPLALGSPQDVFRNVNLARLEPGAHFGELALMSEKGAKRMATVKALLPSGLLQAATDRDCAPP